MNPTLLSESERYRRLRELVDRAADLPPEEWMSFLERESPTDPAIQCEALRLLEHTRAISAEGFLDPAATTGPPSGPPTDGGSAPGSDGSTHVGKYRIVRRFSEASGQAAAYLALDPDLERHVVLKRYHEGGHGASGEAEEGRALSKVVSPYVARCHGIERVDGSTFLVVEYIPGRNLAEVRRDGPTGIVAAVRIVAQLAEGVAAVHARGLIHRDIKPANVILHDDGVPRLVDFGLAAHLGSHRLREIGGSPPYMAPEQARGEWDRIDHRTDVFGLGAVLYNLLTGRAPYAGTNLREILERARKAEIATPRGLDPAIPAPLEAVCLKALAAAPENRHATALEFAAALRRSIEPTPSRTRRALPTAAVIVGALMAASAWWLWPRGARTTTDAGPADAPATAADPLQAGVAVSHYKELGDGHRVVPRGTISGTSLAGDPPRLRDLVRVRVTLSRPAYAYLIALNPNGMDQLCIPAVGVVPGPPRRELEFPEDPADYFDLTDGVGLQAFVVVASDRRLPEYESWKAQVPGGLAWSRLDQEGFWTYDSAAPSEAARSRGTLRGTIVRREAAPEALVGLCDRLRRSPGVTLVRAVAFPVKPDHDVMK